MPSQRRARPGVLAASLGGALWPLWARYGAFEMIEPWGAAKEYREGSEYSPVTNASLFVAHSTTGALALLLAAGAPVFQVGVIACFHMRGDPRRWRGKKVATVR